MGKRTIENHFVHSDFWKYTYETYMQHMWKDFIFIYFREEGMMCVMHVIKTYFLALASVAQWTEI